MCVNAKDSDRSPTCNVQLVVQRYYTVTSQTPGAIPLMPCQQHYAAILAISQRCAELPELDTRSADEILGYDKNGLPN
jgi:hypothetical protein